MCQAKETNGITYPKSLIYKLETDILLTLG